MKTATFARVTLFAAMGMTAAFATSVPSVAACRSCLLVAQQHDHPAAAPEPDEAKPELAPDVEFALWISQVRGHLLIGNDLVKEKQWKAAYPHFQHPIEELYKVLAPRLAEYQAPPFDVALKALSNAVKARKQADYDTAWKAVSDALAKADDGLKAKQKDWPAFAVTASVETLKSSIEEYTSALEKGRITKPVEYQDARGFIWQSESMIESVASALEQKNAGALKQLRAAYADLKLIFPTPVPPKTPVKGLDAMKKDIGSIEAAAGPLM
jgi:hypothetical protein